MGYNQETGSWNCWSCGVFGSGPIALTVLALEMREEEALERVLPYVLAYDSERRERKVVRRHLLPEMELLGLVPLPETAQKYLRERGIPLEFAERKGARWSMENRRLIVPVETDWWVGRRIVEDPMRPKYLFPKFFPRTTILYNYQEYSLSKEVAVVEGVFDAWKVELAGYPCVATFGSAVTKLQLELLRAFHSVIVVPDNDLGGQTFSNALSKLQVAELWTVPQLRKKDIGEYDVEEVRSILATKKRFWEVYGRIFR